MPTNGDDSADVFSLQEQVVFQFPAVESELLVMRKQWYLP
jgi:hypothetical protein